MKKGIVAFALGTFALGMTEYVMMSILDDLARDFSVSIYRAGHLISAYAISSVAIPRVGSLAHKEIFANFAVSIGNSVL